MTTTARINLRLDAEVKASITHAAKLRGVAVATFVRQAALREAEAVTAKASAPPKSPSARLRGRATARLRTDVVMRLTRGA